MRFERIAALAALIVLVATPVEAQRRGDRPMPTQSGVDVEAALRLREELKLTPAQITELQNLRRELVAQRQKEAVERIDLQSRIAAGEVERDEMRKQLESRRAQMAETMKQRRAQFDRILTEDQRGQLNRAHMNKRRVEMRAPRGGRPGIRGEPPRRRWR